MNTDVEPQESSDSSEVDLASELDADQAPSAAAPGLAARSVAARVKWIIPVVLIVMAAVTQLSVQRHDDNAEAGVAARAAVSKSVEELLSYNYKTMDSELKAEVKLLTPAFASKYSKVVTTTVIPAATAAKASTTAKISSAGVVSSSGDNATILLFVTISTKGGPDGTATATGSRLEVKATKHGKSWLIRSIDPV